MLIRCLVAMLMVAGLARPLISGGSGIPWLGLMILICGAISAGVMASVTEPEQKKQRWGWVSAAALCGLVAFVLLYGAQRTHGLRFGQDEEKALALVLDASDSMARPAASSSLFEKARNEAISLVENSPRGTAFSLVLASEVPEVIIARPTPNRSAVIEALRGLTPRRGGVSMVEAFSQAYLTLREAPAAAAARIVCLTDGQKAGWDTEQLSAWSRWQALRREHSVEVMVQALGGAPVGVAVSVHRLETSRALVSTDRPVTLRVLVKNHGKESITPSPMVWLVDGQEVAKTPLSSLSPESESVVECEYHFKTVGAHHVQARLVIDDETPADNEAQAIVEVREAPPVLIVEGASGGALAERPGSIAAMALAPLGVAENSLPVRPRVLTMTQLGTQAPLDDVEVVILADVPSLHSAVARQIAEFVAQGGGLIIALGARAQPDFYTQWPGGENQAKKTSEPFLPLEFKAWHQSKREEKPLQLDSKTWRDPWFRWRQGQETDLSTYAPLGQWHLEPKSEAAMTVGARLSNGWPFLLSRPYGRGQITVLNSSWDAATSNLATRSVFVPWLHEMIQTLVCPVPQPMTAPVARQHEILLTQNTSAQGLWAAYYDDWVMDRPRVTRVDRTVDFDWGEGSAVPGAPADKFSVRWSGWIVPRVSGKHWLQAEGDDRFYVTLHGEQIIGPRRREEGVDFIAGEKVPIVLDFREETGHARARLYWQGPGLEREIVPASCLIPSVSDDATSSTAGEIELTPVGSGSTARALFRPMTPTEPALLRVIGAQEAGLYRFTVSETVPEALMRKLNAARECCFVVTPKEEESDPRLLSEAERLSLAETLNLSWADSVETTTGWLAGRAVGQELWRPLLCGLIFFLIAEAWLAQVMQRRRQPEAESR